MSKIPEGLGVARDMTSGEPKGLLAFWWTVPIARVDHDKETGDIVVTVTAVNVTSFVNEGVGTLNGWLGTASPQDVLEALDEPT